MNSEEKHIYIANKAFKEFLAAFDITEVEQGDRKALKFSTEDPANLLASLSQVHDKLYRVLIAMHLTTLSADDKLGAVKLHRRFVDSYLDVSEQVLVDIIKAGEPVGTLFKVVK